MIFTFCPLPTLEEIPVIVKWHWIEFEWDRGATIDHWLDLWSPEWRN